MGTKKTALLFGLLGAFALAFAAGCGGDDTNGGSSGGTDGGSDVVVPPTDSAPPPDSGPPPDGGPPPDAGCDFNAFVTGLITNHTNATDLPSTDLGESCTDTQTPFPPALFQ